jgi:predicted deacylase
VAPGEFVNKDKVLGIITDVFGNLLEEIKSPIDAVVQIIHYPAAKHTGDPLYSLQGLKGA